MLGKASVFECGYEDNFWAMGGEQGLPCGPCTELYYDFSAHLPADGQGGGSGVLPPDDPHCMEVWNLVFMQHQHAGSAPEVAGTAFDGVAPWTRLSSGGCIDTGMGLERITSVVQGVQNSIFKIDTLSALVSQIRQRLLEVTGKADKDIPYADFSDALHSRDEAVRHASTSLRVIADHIRSASIILSDGVVPSASGRGHVLRRIIRRAVLHARLLGLEHQPFLASLVPFVAESLSTAYPELSQRRESIESLLELEEELTHRSLHRGVKSMEEAMDKASGRGRTHLEAWVVHELHDSLGFPAELAAIFAERRGFTVPMQEVEQLIEEQREKSRLTWSGSGELAAATLAPLPAGPPGDAAAPLEAARHEPYGPLIARDARILSISRGPSSERGGEDLGGNAGVFVALDPCPFYAEGGGQVGDTGVLESSVGSFAVVDCKKRAGAALVELRQPGGEPLTPGHVTALQRLLEDSGTVTASVDRIGRAATCRNHTATHLLHASLRAVLGPAVHQAGSYVGPDRLRFDFTAPAALTAEQVEEVEARVRSLVAQELEVSASEHGHEEALSMGAISLFSDKHSDKELVRVVSVAGAAGEEFASKEWCGGTHVANTADIRPFVIVSERSVAAGTRRIECLTGAAADEHLLGQRNVVTAAAQVLHSSPLALVDDVKERVESEKALKVALDQEKLQGLVRSLPEPLRTTADGGIPLALYDLASLPPPPEERQASDKKKRQPSLLQRLRAVAPQLVAREPVRVSVLLDQGMALFAANGKEASAALAAAALTGAVEGCKAAGKASAVMGMVLLPRGPGGRERVLRALGQQ